ncbi:MAG TPA: RNA-directed DNA polymerase [Candidatus Scatomorpha intestinipullorum]|nr:RNA-directed DNA polymerase [Candidatus Scatomorpha intestinipullorum]
MYKTILELNSNEAKNFFLKDDSYCNFNLPPYFKFNPLLQAIDKRIDSSIYQFDPKKCEGVNYRIFNNKDGKFDWRPLELINPFLYVLLVKEITGKWSEIQERFEVLQQDNRVKCCSIPIISNSQKSDKAEQILKWWEEIEQASIKCSIKYNYLLHTDITNFYSSIYTHSIPWALHTRKKAKKERDDKLIGNAIDRYIQKMSYGQTNGIPQGSVLMDFISEIILADIDSELSQTLEIDDFEIIRYRDDYRIFTNNPEMADKILQKLSAILAERGLKLNPKKTMATPNLIQGSIKPDKIAWLSIESNLREHKTLQKQLIMLHQFSLEYNNCGTLTKVFHRLLKDLNMQKNTYFKVKNLDKENIEVLIAILVDIVSYNPKIFDVIMGVLGILFGKIQNENSEFIKDTIEKLKNIYNNGYVEIWLQRAIIKNPKLIGQCRFEEKICKEVEKYHNTLQEPMSLWNNEWLKDEAMKDLLKKYPIIDKNEIDGLAPSMQSSEINIFEYK